MGGKKEKGEGKSSNSNIKIVEVVLEILERAGQQTQPVQHPTVEGGVDRMSQQGGSASEGMGANCGRSIS